MEPRVVTKEITRPADTGKPKRGWHMESFYKELVHHTQPFDGQYPRPWMTDLTSPLEADCFIVGYNQRNGYRVADIDRVIGGHLAYVDSLLNRNGRSCRKLYDQLFSQPSPTRRNIDRLSRKLKNHGAKVLETNVVCHSSAMSGDLTGNQCRHGTGIFTWLVNRIGPKVIIVHGQGARNKLSKVNTGTAVVIPMRSLAPPEYNKWHTDSEQVMDDKVAEAVEVLRRG